MIKGLVTAGPGASYFSTASCMERLSMSSDTHDASVFERASQIIDRIRPAVQDDGGDLELVDITAEGVAQIRLHGACVGCPSSSMTLHMGIERNLKEKVPEITGVEQVP